MLTLASDEKSLLSGSWDRNVYDWDLNTGQTRRDFLSNAGQVSGIAFRPFADNWHEVKKDTLTNGMSGGRRSEGGTNGVNGTSRGDDEDAPGSPAESTRSFGSLFGDDDDEMGGMSNSPAAPPPAPPAPVPAPSTDPDPITAPSSSTDQNIFLASSMDGTFRIWDRRQSSPMATSTPSKGVPPWCMSSCWSTDGNFVYVGRRNGTVEEFSVHKGIGEAVRTMKFPLGSGPVSAVWAMPNGKHLIW